MRHKILISAYATSPDRGSECAVGWQVCKRLGRYHDITVLHVEKTPGGAPYSQEIARWEDEYGKVPGVRFMPVSMPRSSKIFTFIHDIGFWPAYYLGYRLWQKAAFQKAVQLHKEKPFELIHQLNMIGFREPGFLWKLDVPFVWGPIGGFVQIPSAFIKESSFKNRCFQQLKNVANAFQRKFAGRSILAAQKAQQLWAVETEGLKTMSSSWCVDPKILLETGTICDDSLITKRPTGQILHLVWSGLIIFRKNLPILLKALYELKDIALQLTVIGDGPEKEKCQLLAEQLGINHKINWLGWVTHDRALTVLKEADVFVFSSVKEATSNVVLEALSFGKPVICHDTCGMGVAVKESCGIKIPLDCPKTSVTGFAQAISDLHNDRCLLERLSHGALKRASELSWDEKAKTFAENYSQIIERQ